MAVEGVAAGTQQASLFSSGATREAENAGSVQQQVAVEVANDSQERQGEAALQLIESSQGLGQNVDFRA